MDGFYHRRGKRLLDLCLAVPTMIILGPLILLISAGVYKDIGSPVIYRANRAGMKGVPFVMYKFRTMKDLRDSDGNLLNDDARITRFGSLLRKLSLDELPELFNIIKGDMSLVGPRPLLLEYTHRYDPEQLRRLDVPQGLTGWAQINGRNAIDWDRKLFLDVWYVDHLSASLDVRIMLLTAWKIVSREGVSHEGYINMPEFLGSDIESIGAEERDRLQRKYLRGPTPSI